MRLWHSCRHVCWRNCSHICDRSCRFPTSRALPEIGDREGGCICDLEEGGASEIGDEIDEGELVL